MAEKIQRPQPLSLQARLTALAMRLKGFLPAMDLWTSLSAADHLQLGNDFESAYRKYRIVGMWMRLRGVSQCRAILDLSRKLNRLDGVTYKRLLMETGESDTGESDTGESDTGESDTGESDTGESDTGESEDGLEMAIAAGHLVLRENPRAAYWQEKEIEIDWQRNNVLWVFLFEIARAAKAGCAIDSITFERAGDYATKLKSRFLKQRELPGSLETLIKSAGRGSHRLDLDPERIRIFQVPTREVLREITT